MDEAFKPDGFALLGPNFSSGAQQPGAPLNLSAPSRWATPGQPARTTTAAAIMLLALVGNGLLLHRLRCGGGCCCGCCGDRFGRRRRRRLDFLLAHLALADLYGCGLALLPQLSPSDAEPEDAAGGWPAGRDATCRLLRLLQSSGLLAPSHMLVLIALERHNVVRGPPHPPAPVFLPSRGALAALGWLLALLLALPQAFVFVFVGGRCLSVFPQLPRWHGQAYAVYAALTGFVAPACLLGGTCGRILWALGASRAEDEEGEEEQREPSRGPAAELPGLAAPPPPPPPPPLLLRLLPVAKCVLPSPPAPQSLPRARARALRLTLALATLFALCGFPRFLLELGLAFASPESSPDGTQTALGSIMAATNAALNPYVCLLFHSHRPWARRLQRSLCRCPDRPQPRRRARHRHQPPPQLAVERPGRWLCPCQTKPPSVSTAVEQGEAEPRTAAPPPETGF